MLRKIYNGVKFLAGLALGQSASMVSATHLRARLPLCCRPDVKNRLFLHLELIDKLSQNALCLGQICSGKDRDVFIHAVAGGKTAYGAKMFINVNPQTSDGLLRHLVAQACCDGVQFLQGKKRQRRMFARLRPRSSDRDI